MEVLLGRWLDNCGTQSGALCCRDMDAPTIVPVEIKKQLKAYGISIDPPTHE